MQYTYTRIRSIFNKKDINSTALLAAPLTIKDDKEEKRLQSSFYNLKKPCKLSEKEGTPHVLCAYLYELAGIFSSIYEHCPILNAKDESIRIKSFGKLTHY